MGRSPCCSKEGLNRGAWTAHEDKILKDFISVHGEGRWRSLPKRAGLKRCGKSCRLRWLNYLRPDIKRGNITPDEEELIVRLHKLLGNRWSLIAGRLPGRTDNEIKNYWNTNLGKKVKNQHHNRLHHQNNNVTSSAQPKTDKAFKNNDNNPVNLKPESISLPSPHSLFNVVRTKATKCSKVVITPRPPPPPPSRLLLQITDTETELLHHPMEDVATAADYNQTTGLLGGADDKSSSRLLVVEKDRHHHYQEPSSSMIAADFSVGEICLSDLLNSDFSGMCDFSNNNSVDGLSPSSDQQPFVFSDDILNDWMQSNNGEDTNVGNNLHSFTSFLESSETWLAE
ncbi:hypothetical protein QN277_026648 [Acacia crassicarpa]|uniref:Myb-related protein 123 n=1 Tax=Acacia crassicarpa TaxID=499986 RepID=A0AAE1JAR2_9FABA|nr:hypothetical protein QN277_026648 [Acacia crassicarpa]